MLPIWMPPGWQGSGTIKIILKHMIPNIAGPVITTAVLDIGTMMMEIAGLSFLGLGAMPPAAEWGSMMSNGRSMLQTSPWVILAPGCAIFLTVIVFNLLGDTVRDLLDPRQRKKGGTAFMTKPLLEISNMEVCYSGKPVVRDLSLKIEPGEILGDRRGVRKRKKHSDPGCHGTFEKRRNRYKKGRFPIKDRA